MQMDDIIICKRGANVKPRLLFWCLNLKIEALLQKF